MTSHNKRHNWLTDSELVVGKGFPVASHDSFDEDEEAQERRREERRKRKKQNRRENVPPVEEGDPDVLLQTPKKPKRNKKKRPRPDLWYDESREDEELDEAFEFDEESKGGEKDQDDWYDE